jgi:hypothetical protein
MTASSRSERMISSEVGDIERRLRILQNGIEKLKRRTSTNARDTAHGLGEALASALSIWSDRFHRGTTSLGEQSATFGKTAARYGTVTVNRVSSETGQRPLNALVIAFGAGILVGFAARGRANW